MTSRFVSGGTIAGDDGPSSTTNTDTTASAPKQSAQWDREASKKNAEWEAVQKDLEAERRRREEARKSSVEGSGEKSLYDILQANKAAKQAAFEEQNRIRNQFRALDDDEIDFLDGIRDERRVEEDRVRRETEERLASFRKAQKSADRAAAPSSSSAADEAGVELEEAVESWGGAAARKRKREKERDIRGMVKGVKRQASSGEAGKENMNAVAKVAREQPSPPPTTTEDKSKDADKPVESRKTLDTASAPAPAKPKLGLVDYGSDEDDDD